MPEVVFLPGFMQHADAWSPIAAAVAERYPVRCLEFASWSFDERVAEIRAAAGRDTVVTGYSMGGRLALHAALGADWAGLVVLGASAGIEDDEQRAARRAADDELAAWIERHPIAEVVKRWERNPVFATQPAELVAAQRPGRLAHEPEQLARLLRSAGQGALAPIWDRLGQLRMPVLALAGEHDSAYVDASERIAALAPRGAANVVAGAGHAPHLEQPEAVRQAIVRFLGGVITAPGRAPRPEPRR